MIGSLLSSFRNVLNLNFFLFIFSLFLFAELFNYFQVKHESFYAVFTTLEYLIPCILIYLFIVTMLTPIIKWIGSVINVLISKTSNYDRKKDYISLSKLEKIAIQKESKALFDYYLKEKEDLDSTQFTVKFAFINTLLIAINYYCIDNGIADHFLNTSNSIVNICFTLLCIFIFLASIFYFKIHDNTEIIPKEYIKDYEEEQ